MTATQSIDIRPAVSSDLTAITELEAACFDADERWDDEAWRVELESGAMVLVASLRQAQPECEVFEQVVGTASFRVAADTSELFSIMTSPQWRGIGVATLLLARGFEWASSQGADEMFLEVRIGNGAQALYADAGFQPLYERTNYYGPGLHALVMRKELSGGRDE